MGASPTDYAVDRGVATITLDSPANRNALSAALVADVVTRLASAEADRSVRAIVLTHTGSTFCSGNDLREASAEGGPRASTERLVTLLRLIVESNKPVVARVDGHARAGGVGLVGACDLAIAGPRSTFAFAEVRLGLAPAVISLTTLGRLSPRAASRYLLTGEVFDAATAAAIGLVTEYAPDPEAALDVVLDALRAGSPQGLAATKALTTAAIRAGFAAQADAMVELSAGLFASAEGREGMAAFLERRPPNWVS